MNRSLDSRGRGIPTKSEGSFVERISQVRPMSLESEHTGDEDDRYERVAGGENSAEDFSNVPRSESIADNDDRYGRDLERRDRVHSLGSSRRAPRRQKFVATYGLYSLVMLGFGNTIGSGVFTLTGVAAKSSGSAVFLGFILSGLIALLTALVFAEFAALIPKSGSSYLYVYTTFGELPAWIVGWN